MEVAAEHFNPNECEKIGMQEGNPMNQDLIVKDGNKQYIAMHGEVMRSSALLLPTTIIDEN
ncbi:unnamed protein product [Sphenostylis stenocarpa]|uniref:Uncharacterized protein n=1 Tax=Sphenostylis stenocarpa TaxID=92480 RepID=A0AA86VE46_9FABA|nr:unnamed protein product [Sphenostylis stenocarpa]